MKCSIPSIGASGSLGLNVSSIAWYRLHKRSKLLRLGMSSWSKTLARSSISEIISCSATGALPAGGCVSDRHFVCLLSGPLPYVWMKRISHRAVRGPRIGQSLISICSIEATAEAKVRMRFPVRRVSTASTRASCADGPGVPLQLLVAAGATPRSRQSLTHSRATSSPLKRPRAREPSSTEPPGSRAIETPCAIFLEKSVTCQAPS